MKECWGTECQDECEVGDRGVTDRGHRLSSLHVSQTHASARTHRHYWDRWERESIAIVNHSRGWLKIEPFDIAYRCTQYKSYIYVTLKEYSGFNTVSVDSICGILLKYLTLKQNYLRGKTACNIQRINFRWSFSNFVMYFCHLYFFL